MWHRKILELSLLALFSLYFHKKTAHFIFIDDEEEAGEVSSLTHSLFKRNPPPVSSCCSETEYLDRENITTMLCSLECKKALKFNSVITIFPKQYFPQSLLPPEIVDSNNFVCTLPGAKLHRIKSNYLLSCLRYSVSL